MGWLDTTRTFQREAFNTDVLALEGAERADYLHYNLTALLIESAEFGAEFGWKPWDTQRGWVNDENALEEAADVMMFLGNILATLGYNDDDIVEAINQKRQKVRERQSSRAYTDRRNT